MKKMGYEGKGIGFNGHDIMNPIQLEELPRYARLGYVREEGKERHSKPIEI